VWQYSYLLQEWAIGQPAHFPLIPKHYDDLIFHYFLLPHPVSFDPIVSWWLTLALVKVSMLAFLFLLFRQIGAGRMLAAAFALYLFLGTPSLWPTKYYLLFDSANFFYFTAHAGRIVGVGLIFLIAADLLRDPRTKRHMSISAFVLLGLGITATSISNAAWLLVFSVWGTLAAWFYQTPAQNGELRQARDGTLLCALALASFALLYGLPFKGEMFYALRLAAVAAVAAFWLMRAFSLQSAMAAVLGAVRRQHPRSCLSMRVFIVAILAGIIVLGNVFYKNPVRAAVASAVARAVGPTQVEATPLFKGRPLPRFHRGNFALGDHRVAGSLF
jgi:hypothetical protein